MERRKIFDDENPELPPPGTIDVQPEQSRPRWNVLDVFTPVLVSNVLAAGIMLHIVVSHFGIFNQNTWYILVCIVLLLLINRHPKA